MFIWILFSAIILSVLIAIYFASFGQSQKPQQEAKDIVEQDSPTLSHFKAQLLEIERDLANGLISENDAKGAKGELAREMIRLEAEAGKSEKAKSKIPTPVLLASFVAIAITSFVIYFYIGKPELPAMPLATREMPAAANIDIDAAVAKIEEQLAKSPEDIRAWKVIVPVYMQRGEFDKAVLAYRKILELSSADADNQADLAEALMMQNGGIAKLESLDLFKSAIKFDPKHVRSLFYLASELTRAGEYEKAIIHWNNLLALSNGEENWLEVAKAGLEAAEAGLNGEIIAPNEPVAIDEDQSQLIREMVTGLAARLEKEGGAIEEWTRLVRSYLVLGENDTAQDIYNKAKAAYPNINDTKQLDALALKANLKLVE